MMSMSSVFHLTPTFSTVSSREGHVKLETILKKMIQDKKNKERAIQYRKGNKIPIFSEVVYLDIAVAGAGSVVPNVHDATRSHLLEFQYQ